MSSSPDSNPFADIWSDPAPIRPARQEKKHNNRVLKPEYQKYLFRCPKNTTKWIRILPNTRGSDYAGQWILAHRVVYFGDIAILDPEFHTKRTSPFSEFHMRLKRAADPAIQRRIRSNQNRDGISTWPKDHGIARVIEIPAEQSEPPKISIVHASMNDGTNGQVGYLYAITELAQATNNDPSLPKELRGQPKYKHSIVDPNHGRIIGLTRTNTYTPSIADNEDYYTLVQRIQTIAEQDPEAVTMATRCGLEHLLYQSTEEEAHQLLQTSYPDIYPHLFQDRITHQSTGIPGERTGTQGRKHSDQIAEAARNIQAKNPVTPPQPPQKPQTPPYDPAQDFGGMEDSDPLFPETLSKAPKADPDELAENGQVTEEDAILNQLLGNEEGSSHHLHDPATNGNGRLKPPAVPYDNKVAMAGEFQKVAQLQAKDPAYQAIKERIKVSGHLFAQLTGSQLNALKKMVGEEKFADLTQSFQTLPS
jgi:hypothetical protein